MKSRSVCLAITCPLTCLLLAAPVVYAQSTDVATPAAAKRPAVDVAGSSQPVSAVDGADVTRQKREAIAIDPAVSAAVKSPKTASDEDITKALNYNTLVYFPIDERQRFLDEISTSRRATFLNGLPGQKRAILLTDPTDCGTGERLKRQAVGKNKQDEGFASNTAKDVGSSLATGTLNAVVPGLGGLASFFSKGKELQKIRQEYVEYVDVCDVTPEERTSLLRPPFDLRDQDRREEGAVDKATKVLAR